MKEELFEKVLSKSNQFKYYKNEFKKFKKLNKKLEKRNRKLEIENIELKKQFGIDNKKKILEKFKKGDYENINVSIKTPNPRGIRHWGDYFYAIALKKALEKRKFNVSIHEKQDWYNHDDEDIVIVLRGLKNYDVNQNSINIIWNISHPDRVKTFEYEKYDLVFIASHKYAREIQKEVTVNVKPLLQCCDPEVFRRKENDNLKDNEILFVGATRGVFREIINDISTTNHNYSIYGPGWEDFIDEEYIKDDFIPNEVLNQYYSSCKILLNDHWEDMRELGFISNRLFDALACGTFIISDKMQEVDTLFEGNIVTYENADDLNEKLTYYLSHDEERKMKAERGQEIVLKNHTFDNRVDEILSSLNELDLE